jgi:hypothetical protein
MANFDLNKIIRDSKTPEEAMRQVNLLTINKPLTTSEAQKVAAQIAGASKFSGRSSSGSTNFTGGSSSSGSDTPIGGATKDSSLFEKGLDALGEGVKAVAGVVNGAAKMAGKGAALTLDSQLGKTGDDTAMGIAKAVGEKGFMSLLDAPGAMLDAVLGQLKQESELLSEVNTKIGISGDLSEGLRDSMISAQVQARKYGFELANIGEFYTSLATQSGKFSLINKETINQAAPVAAALGMTLSELADSIGEYEKVGLGAKETTKAIGNAATRAVSLGLNARKIADEMKGSIGKLNEYGFKNGVEGLERMVQKSVEFKLSMDKVASIADKVLNPEGAVDLAANLQVLGGAIGDFGDPIKMMYDATNNMEGLQDSIIGAAKGLATYNQAQGRFEITGINLRRGKEMASALGMTMEELGKTAIAAQERVAASTALMSTGLKIEDKEKEFLTNLSRMQDGEMKIVVPESIAEKLGVPTAIALDKLDQKTADALIKNQKEFEKMSPAQMADKQLTSTQQMARDIEVMASWAKIQAAAYLKGAGKEALGKEVEIIRNDIARVAGKLNVDRNSAENAGAQTVKAIKSISITDIESMKNAYQKTKEGLSTTFNTNQQPQAQQATAQTTQQNIHVTSDVNSDYFKEVIKKDAAFGFEFKNTDGYNVLTPAKRKGK